MYPWLFPTSHGRSNTHVKDTVSTLTILVPSPSLGNTIFYCLTKFYIGWKPMVSPSTHSNGNGPFRKLVGLATGSHPLVWILGIRKLMAYFIWKKTKKISQMRGFLGAVNHYWQMWLHLQRVWEEDILLDPRNRSHLQMHESANGVWLSPCLPWDLLYSRELVHCLTLLVLYIILSKRLHQICY